MILITHYDIGKSTLITLGWIEEFHYPIGSMKQVFVLHHGVHYKLDTWGNSGFSSSVGVPTPDDLVFPIQNVGEGFLVEKALGAELEALHALCLLTKNILTDKVMAVFIANLRHDSPAVSQYAEAVLGTLFDGRAQLALARLELRREHDRAKGKHHH